MKSILSLVVIVFAMTTLLFSCKQSGPQKILVFTKTTGFRHYEAIDAGVKALTKVAAEQGYEVSFTENSADFNETNLKAYKAVIFHQVSGSIFNQQERTAFQRFIQAGGGFLGIHAPTDAERSWPWYGKLVGAYFDSHPSDPHIRKGRYKVVDKTHPATRQLPDSWEREDEFYNFQQVNPDIRVLIELDEKSYEGGNMGDHHPAVWYHNYDGGRSMYIAMGHTNATYSEPLFEALLSGAMEYITGGKNSPSLNYANVIPEENRFQSTTLIQGMDEPMHLAFNADGSKIYIAQRRGTIVEFDRIKNTTTTIGTIAVNSRFEDGLLGIVADPDFSTNKWIYLFYTIPSGEEFHISRFTLAASGQLDAGSKKILLKIPKEILDGSHTGGGLCFDPRGSGDLYITVGDNTSPRATGFGPNDEQDGRIEFNAQRSSSNTNDLRGKILRIHPEKDGTYTIPEGNLFASGTKGTRPEIYSMGHRQPWRIFVDSKTGWLFEGEVGPDASEDSIGRGPAGQDEFNIIRKPGNYGWPYFVGNNKAYHQFDFKTGLRGDSFRVGAPVNESKYNTGLNQLPPAQPALIWYPYGESKEFPLMGSGGRSAVGGPVFRKNDYKETAPVFPSYYEGKWLIADWMRSWIMSVSFDEQGKFVSMEPFLPELGLTSPIDLQMGPDGALYVLEYGSGWFQANKDARLVRIEYNNGNRQPVAKASAGLLAGEIPFTTILTVANSFDPDGDGLTYSWVISDSSGKELQQLSGDSATVSFKQSGVYKASLIVKDGHGAVAKDSVRLRVGNALPEIQAALTEGNMSFYFPGKPFRYAVTIYDKEDGAIQSLSDDVAINIDYLPKGINSVAGSRAQGHQTAGESGSFEYIGPQLLINGSDCYSCHKIEGSSVGPSFTDVAKKYKPLKPVIDQLAANIIHGSAGNWGDVRMSAHPTITKEDAISIVEYILTLNGKQPAKKESLPLNGRHVPAALQEPVSGAAVVLTAAYTDAEVSGVPGEKVVTQLILRSPNVPPAQADSTQGAMIFDIPGYGDRLVWMYGQTAWLQFAQLDLTGITGLEVSIGPQEDGYLEIRSGTADGPLLAKTPTFKKADRKTSFKLKWKAIAGQQNLFIVVRSSGMQNKYDFVCTIDKLVFKTN